MNQPATEPPPTEQQAAPSEGRSTEVEGTRPAAPSEGRSTEVGSSADVRGQNSDSGSKGHWTIRSRLTVRGFKDNQKDEIARYAGTSTRGGQKALVSEAVRHGWPICTLDVWVAFLKGVTYEELAKLTGEPMREVNFYLPAVCIPLLRTVRGFEDFDPRTEV